MSTYGSFPGVRVTTESGGIQAVEIGEEEKLAFFGEANYTVESGSVVVDGDATINEPTQIGRSGEAPTQFGDGSELSNAMQNSLAGSPGANTAYLYGVAVDRKVVEAEPQTQAEGTLDNVEIVENTGVPADLSEGEVNDFGIEVVSDPAGAATTLDVELRYSDAPGVPDEEDKVFINPLTGEYATSVTSDLEFTYAYNDYAEAFSKRSTQNIVNEDETGIFFALSDSDSVSADLNNTVGDLRSGYQLVNALSFAEPNDQMLYDSANVNDENGGADARYDTPNFTKGSVSAAYYYKFAPARVEDEDDTIGGGLGGLFAGNPINDPIYNETISGYDALEQQLVKSEADEFRAADVIPVRSGGNVRVKGNRSTSYSVADTVAADFWTRRITDRIILIGKQIGDAILGRINDEDTRSLAERRIKQEMRSLESQRLIQPNIGEETNWTVEVYEDPTNSDEVNVDIAFTPYGIVKNVDETITLDT